MSDGEVIRVFRVTVRGRFADLTDRARALLVRSQADHDIFLSAYTPEGTFTYDAAIAFFNLRYELRGVRARRRGTRRARSPRRGRAFPGHDGVHREELAGERGRHVDDDERPRRLR